MQSRCRLLGMVMPHRGAHSTPALSVLWCWDWMNHSQNTSPHALQERPHQGKLLWATPASFQPCEHWSSLVSISPALQVLVQAREHWSSPESIT